MQVRSILQAAKSYAPVILVALVAVCAGSNVTEARTHGSRSASELASSKAETWRGYGEAGYIIKSKKHRSASARRSFRAAVKASGYTTRTVSRKSSRVRTAALNYGLNDASAPRPSATGGGVRWAASSSCLNGTLASIVSHVAANYGSVTVNSTCRSRSHNAAVGGAHRSQHLTGNAVDFRVHGNAGAVYAYLRSSGSVGGLKHYGGGLFHIDTGARRSW